ncbi:MAG: ParA family protein [Magnetococcales bacterium]|nr:ParA family protein [Magnetococcales bacterium]
MKIVSIFNNKGGVGKTTLTFHLAHALAVMGHKTLLIDLDLQCNLTVHGLEQEELHDICKSEDKFNVVDNFCESVYCTIAQHVLVVTLWDEVTTCVKRSRLPNVQGVPMIENNEGVRFVPGHDRLWEY